MHNLTFEDQDEFFLSMAVFSAFIDKGMRASPAFSALVSSRLGEVDLIAGAATMAPLAVRLERAVLRNALPSLTRGTMEHEVCEPFGTWYVQHCAGRDGNPDEGLSRDRMADAIIEHFSSGQSPQLRWSIVRAVKAEEPAVRLPKRIMDESINWEWAPRCAVAREVMAREEHPMYPRAAWLEHAGPAHVSEYWPWVEHTVRTGYVRTRYEALAANRSVFMELVKASIVVVDGRRLCQLHVRRDLVAQECIDGLPAHTVFAAGLFSALPGLQRAFCELDAGFSLAEWIARPVSDFMAEHSCPVDPDATAIIAGSVNGEGGECPFACTLTSLWNAVQEGVGSWRLDDGTVLFLQADEHAAQAVDMISEFLQA